MQFIREACILFLIFVVIIGSIYIITAIEDASNTTKDEDSQYKNSQELETDSVENGISSYPSEAMIFYETSPPPRHSESGVHMAVCDHLGCSRYYYLNVPTFAVLVILSILLVLSFCGCACWDCCRNGRPRSSDYASLLRMDTYSSNADTEAAIPI